MFALTKRVFLFTLINILVLTTITISWKFICYFFGIENAYWGSLIFFSACFGMGGAFVSLFLSKFMAKRFMGVQIVDSKTHPEFHSLIEKVHRLSRNSKLPAMPEVGIYNSPEVNAFATGPSKRNSLVAVSTGLLNKLNEDEVEGVIGHEVAHIANGDMVTMTLIQGIINAFVIFLSRIIASIIVNQINNERGRFFLHFALVIGLQILFSILGSIVVNYFSRIREYRADKGGAKLAGKDKMISALQALMRRQNEIHQKTKHQQAFQALKISTSRKESLWAALLSTHPPLEKRIRNLERA